MSERKSNADNKEIKSKLKEVEAENPFVRLEKAYGGISKLPDSVKPINRFAKTGSLLGSPIETAIPNYKIKGVGADEEVRKLPGSDAFGKDAKFYITKKGAPGLDSLTGSLASLVDTVTFQKTDLDRLGKKFNARPELIDLTDPKNYELSEIEKNIVKRELETAGIDETKDDPFDDDEKRLDFLERNADRINKLYRDRGRSAAIDSQLQYMAMEPVRQAFANRAAESAAQRGLRIRAAKEAMPSNIQNIMLSKQAQAATASSAEAERARAAADQQDAASRFASLGMQRRFG